MEKNYLKGYTFCREIASGFLGPTHLAVDNQTRQDVIIKFFNNQLLGMERVHMLIQRINTIRSLQCSFIVAATHCFIIDTFPSQTIFSTLETSNQKNPPQEKASFLVVIRPYINACPLPLWMKQTANIQSTSELRTKDDSPKMNNDENFSNKVDQTLSLWKSIVYMIHYLHQHDIFPSFLKPNNLFINDEKTILITDVYPPPDRIDAMVHSPNSFDLGFLAPEFFETRQKPSHHSDTWSLGILLFYMSTGSLPWSNKNVFTMINQIITQSYVNGMPIPQKVDQFISVMLIGKPEHRIELEDILNESIETKYFIENHRKFGGLIRRPPTSQSVPVALNEMAGNVDECNSQLPVLRPITTSPSQSNLAMTKKCFNFSKLYMERAIPNCILRYRLKQ